MLTIYKHLKKNDKYKFIPTSTCYVNDLEVDFTHNNSCRNIVFISSYMPNNHVKKECPLQNTNSNFETLLQTFISQLVLEINA